MSSDKLGSIQQPILSLDLDITEGTQKKRENMELSREELEKLITSLEAANKVRESLVCKLQRLTPPVNFSLHG